MLIIQGNKKKLNKNFGQKEHNTLKKPMEKKRGRKPITDCSKRVPLRVMVEMCTINEWGGMKRAQMYVQDFLERGPDDLPKRKRDCI